MQKLFFVSLHTLTICCIALQLIIDADCFLVDTNESGNRIGSNMQQPYSNSIMQFHDSMIKHDKKSNYGFRSRSKSRRASPPQAYNLLPANDRLRKRYFSKRVVDDSGHAKKNRFRRNHVQQSSPLQQYYYYPDRQSATRFTGDTQQVPLEQQKFTQTRQQPLNANAVLMDKERRQDLEEIFRILARRNDPEQIRRLRDAMDRVHGVFEFMEVDEMPPIQREPTIRKILQRTLNIDVENAAKKARIST